jgi:hypothetical protein
MFESLMLPLCECGNSDWTGPRTTEEIEYDIFVKDVAFIVESLRLEAFVLL